MAKSLHILLGPSACLQWLCHSGERTVACGPLVILLPHQPNQFLLEFCWQQNISFFLKIERKN